MKKIFPFLQALAQILGQSLPTSDETQTHTLMVDGEELFLRYLPEDDLWVYFGFITDFMSEVTPAQLEKALELNLFGRGTANYYCGLIGKAIVLSGRLPMLDATPEQLAEQLFLLAQHITPLHQALAPTTDTSDILKDETISTDTNDISHFSSSFLIQV